MHECGFRERINPDILKQIYYGEHYVECIACNKILEGWAYRDKCNCKFCQDDSDELCVSRVSFLKNEVVCPGCGIVLIYYCSKNNLFIPEQEFCCKSNFSNKSNETIIY